jgi:hypothetical protein
MFHNDWTLWQLAQEHQRDLERQIEQARLARLAKSTHDRRGRRFYRALGWLGRQLIVVGEHMQARHKAVMTAAALHAAYHARSSTHSQRG